ncbi:hypothetical protein CBOM_07850 [Ceraceosorus bombacis]|uniref:Uncharacterized protein n=1 Tax=Ceraceosorus bombacis TaxID=401625 RepID=A0A0P1BQ14_9BASI|nr:hypothetical protein CBOM_07850 [Ceraceosorus bombacis]
MSSLHAPAATPICAQLRTEFGHPIHLPGLASRSRKATRLTFTPHRVTVHMTLHERHVKVDAEKTSDTEPIAKVIEKAEAVHDNQDSTHSNAATRPV